MSRILHRQLIGHEDLALGFGKVIQERGPETLNFQQIELEWIFRNANEIKALDYNRYTHVAIHTIPEGPVIQYYYDPSSMAVPDDATVIKPNSVTLAQSGRYIITGALDTIIASASDEFTPIVIGGPKTTFRSPYPMSIVYVRISLTTAPTGAAFIVDVTMNGTSLFSTLLQIDANMKSSVGSAIPAVLSTTLIPDDAEYLVYVTQIGSSVAGSGLKVAVTGRKAG